MSGPLILAVFVPGLLFQAAITLDRAELRRHLAPIALLATLGVAMTVLTVGALVHLLLGLSWAAGLLLGAILAATDPIAVVSMLRRVKAPAGVAALLEGESLFNDGTGVAAFTAIVGSILAGAIDGRLALVRFALLTLVGTATGILIGLAGRLFLRRLRLPLVRLLVSIAVAYGSYLVAAPLGGSGVVAVVAAGLMLAAACNGLTGRWDQVAVALNVALFLILGLQFPTRAVIGLSYLVLAVFGLMLISRLLPVYGLLAVADPRVSWIPWRWRHLVFWSGMRGGLSIALALSLVGLAGVDARVATVGYGVVGLSLLVQGGLLRPVARLLGLSRS